MGIASTIAGLIIIAVGLYDMFHSLLHPRGKGPLSHALISWIWRLSRWSGHRFGSAVGPVGLVVAVIVWVGLQGLGWALIYLPHVPDGFTYSPGIDPSRYHDLAASLYISFVTLATLGFGDVVSTVPWVRAASPLEALTGFALLTAALTWFTQIYPPLTRRRVLALQLHALTESGYAKAIPSLHPAAAGRVLEALAAEINSIHVDLTQHTESYYFLEEDSQLSLAHQLPHVVDLRDAASDSPSAELQASAGILSQSLEQLTMKLQDILRIDGTLHDVLSAYAADHTRASST